MRELASGVDALYLSGRTDLPASLLSSLESSRVSAQESGSPAPLTLGGYDWSVARHGLLKWKYRVEHPLAVIGLTGSEHLPSVRVQARSEALHSLGADGFMAWIGSVFENEGLEVGFTVSRIDLHHDCQGWALTGDDRHRFVCRARDLATYEADFELSGFSFGNRTSQTVTARIYDKTREIDGKGGDWWFEHWGPRYVEGSPVYRVEFEFARDCLRGMGLDSPTDVLPEVGRLWAYGTRDWLTYREPSAHARAARWPVAPEWEAVQASSLGLGSLPMDRIRAGARAGSLRKLLPGLNGYVASFAALTGEVTIGGACAALPAHLAGYEMTSGVPFAERVIEKRKSLP